MKNQRELLALPWHTAPIVEIEPFHIYTYTDAWGKKPEKKCTNYIYRCDVCGEDVLVMTVYTVGGDPLFRSFMDRVSLKSQYYEGQKASDSTVLRYVSDVLRFQWYYGAKLETDENSRAVINEWLKRNKLVPLKSSETPFDAVKDVQNDIRRRAVERRNEKIRKSIDDNMLEIKPLPKRFGDWIDKVVMKNSRYIVYEYSGRKKQNGWCTHCKTDILVEGAKNGAYGKCPNCKSAVKYISRGRMSQRFMDKGECSYIQPDKNGSPIFRYFEVQKYYYTNDFRTYNVNTYVHEQFRWFYDKDKRYNWDNFRQTGEMRFCEVYYSSRCGSCGFVYPYNLQKVFENAVDCNDRSYIKYIPFTRLLNNQVKGLDPHKLYVAALQKPIIEYLAKLKLYRLCNDVISNSYITEYFNMGGESFKEVFPKGINRGDIRFFVDNDIDIEEMEIYFECKSDVSSERLREGIRLYREGSFSSECVRLLKYTSPQKLIKYAKKMKSRYSWDEGLRRKTGDWADYIEIAEKLGWDLKDDFILFPKDFWEAHDRASNLLKIENVKKQNKAVAKIAKLLNREYKMEGKEFFIRAAVNAEEIVAEGQALHHCVATYVDRVAKGETGILVMRSVKEPDKPLYTIEVRNGVLIQCRGKNNRDMDKKNEKAFFNRWKSAKLKEETRKAG